MVAIKNIVLIILGILALLAFLILWVNGFINLRFSPPDKEKLVRYYACVLAICTKGCNHEWLDANTTPDEIAMCIERDPITKKCKKWCKQICEENGWLDTCDQPGKCCNQSYNVSVNLEGKAYLKGLYWARYHISIFKGTLHIDYKTGIMDTLIELNRTENFPLDLGEKKLYYFYLPRANIYGKKICSDLYSPEYEIFPEKDGDYKPNMPAGPIVREGGDEACNYKDANSIVGSNVGIGALVVTTEEARKIFSCIDTTFSDLGVTWDAAGFTSCVFEGSLRMWPLQSPVGDGYVDVVIVSNKYTSDNFILTLQPPNQVVPLNNWATYTTTIINKISSEDQTQFSLSIDYPENVECKWENEESDYMTITLPKNTQESLNFKCKPKDDGNYEIKVYALGSVYSQWASVTLSTSNYNLKCIPTGCSENLLINKKKIFEAVEIYNYLGFDEKFNLKIEGDTVNCTFENGYKEILVNVENNKKLKLNIACNASQEGDYEIKIKSKPESLENLEKEVLLSIHVSACQGPIKIEFQNEMNQVVQNIPAGNKIKVLITAEGCDGKIVSLAVNRTDYILSTSVFNMGIYEYPEQDYSYVSTPGTYTFYAWSDFDNDNIYEEGRENVSSVLIVGNPDEQAKKTCGWCKDNGNNYWCTYYHYGGICQHCNPNPFGCDWVPCKYACNPQSCIMDVDNYLPRDCAKYSNICCINNNLLLYSNGPDTFNFQTPCLSVDILKADQLTNNWIHRGVLYAKNVLVDDRFGLDEIPVSFAIFYNTYPSSKLDCTAENILNHPEELKDATTVEIDTPVGKRNACSLSSSLPPYLSWLFIRVSESPRPIYGIYLNGLCIDPHGHPASGGLVILLHNSSGWFLAGIGNIFTDGYFECTSTKLLPSNFAWEADALLIGSLGAYGANQDRELELDYIGLLTVDKETPFCTDDSGNYNRLVNDAKTCYWGLECSTSGNGWKYKGKSIWTGFLSECDCSSGTCGYGYYEKIIDGNKFCFSGIECKNGGWTFKSFQKCDSNQKCTWKGCE